MKIAIYCVNYHSYQSLADYMKSIDSAMQNITPGIILNILVADNTVPNSPVDYSPKYFALKIVPTGENLGYFGAISYLMQSVAPIDFDYSIISNVDVLLTDSFFTELLSQRFTDNTGWIAPAILSQKFNFDFNPQAIKPYSLRKMKLLRLMFRYPFLLFLKQKLLHMYHDIIDCPPGNIYAGHGSFVILTNSFFKKCNTIDYPIFLYGEEIYLAETCKQNNLLVEYAPSIKVYDIGKVSTSQIPSKTYCQYNYQAIDYIIKKFYSSTSR